MKVGDLVEVVNHFEGGWATGFVLAGQEEDDRGRPVRRRVQRISDGAVLPFQFPAREVRQHRSLGWDLGGEFVV